MKTLKSIDGKSLLIGGLLASTVFFAMGATGPADKWDDEQSWQVISVENKPPFDASAPKNAVETANWIRIKSQRISGKEPFAVTMDKGGKARVWYRKRNK